VIQAVPNCRSLSAGYVEAPGMTASECGSKEEREHIGVNNMPMLAPKKRQPIKLR
jgi:hypothetical protein